MTILQRADAVACALVLGSALLSSASACGSKSDNAGSGASSTGGSSDGSGNSAATDSSAGSDASGDGSTPAPEGCPKSALTILFSPMYSAYDGEHTFQVPVVVNGLDPKQVDITWSASDPSMVKIEPDPTTGGVMLTTRKAGKVSIIANAGGLCGYSLLTITSATPQDWTDGNARYNDGVVINRLPGLGGGGGGRPGGGMGGGAMGGSAIGGSAIGGGGMGGSAIGGSAGTAGASTSAEAACTNCHGDTASGPFKTVQHTPEQTGGFSDDELIKIFQDGVVPDGGYFDASIVSYQVWQSFHKWDVGDTPQSVVTYLRSLTPAAQTGMANFGGRQGGGGAGGRGGGGAPTGGAPTGGAATGGVASGGTATGGTATGGTATGGTATGGAETGGGGGTGGT